MKWIIILRIAVVLGLWMSSNGLQAQDIRLERLNLTQLEVKARADFEANWKALNQSEPAWRTLFNRRAKNILAQEKLSETEKVQELGQLMQKMVSQINRETRLVRDVLQKKTDGKTDGPAPLTPIKDSSRTSKPTEGDHSQDPKPYRPNSPASGTGETPGQGSNQAGGKDSENNTQAGDPEAGSQQEEPDPTHSGQTQDSLDLKGGIVSSIRGALAYFIPDTMRVGEVVQIELIVSGSRRAVMVIARNRQGEITIDSVRLSEYMEAQLIDFGQTGEDDGAFAIRALNSATQKIELEDSTAVTVWEWTVRPRSAGRHNLGIKVSIITYDRSFNPPKENIRSLDAFERTVQVIALPQPPKPQTGWGLYGGIAVVAIALLGVLIWWMRKQRSGKGMGLRPDPFAHVVEGDGIADPATIRALISAGELDRAIGELLDLAGDTHQPEHNDLIAFRARLNRLKKEQQNQVITRNEAEQEKNKLTHALLSMLEELSKS